MLSEAEHKHFIINKSYRSFRGNEGITCNKLHGECFSRTVHVLSIHGVSPSTYRYIVLVYVPDVLAEFSDAWVMAAGEYFACSQEGKGERNIQVTESISSILILCSGDIDLWGKARATENNWMEMTLGNFHLCIYISCWINHNKSKHQMF